MAGRWTRFLFSTCLLIATAAHAVPETTLSQELIARPRYIPDPLAFPFLGNAPLLQEVTTAPESGRIAAVLETHAFGTILYVKEESGCRVLANVDSRARHLRWAPDEQSLCFLAWTDWLPREAQKPQLHYLPLRPTPSFPGKLLSTASGEAGRFAAPAWAPSGKKVAWITAPDEIEFVTVETQTTEVLRLPGRNLKSLVWPTEEELLVTEIGAPGLHAVELATGRMRQVSSATFSGELVLGNNRRILYSRLVMPDGRLAEKLLNTSGQELPAFVRTFCEEWIPPHFPMEIPLAIEWETIYEITDHSNMECPF